MQSMKPNHRNETDVNTKEDLRREFADFFPTKMPDAAILYERDYPIDVIEIGGVYSADDLRHIHQSYSRERFRYELW